MAPNVKHIFQLSHSLATLQVSRSKDVFYQPLRAVEGDSDSYWAEWTIPPKDLFSADHLTANCVMNPSFTADEAETRASSDDYWAEESPREVIDSVSYFAETSYTKTGMAEDAEYDYWNEAAPVHRGADDASANKENYWNEAVHVQSASDAYWAVGESTAQYWSWNAAEQTGSDRYWSLP